MVSLWKLVILVLAGLFWPLRPCSALRILNLVDPNPNLTSLANNSPQISATFTQLPADLRFVLRDPLRNMQPLGIEHLVPFPSLEPGPPELVHVFVASIDLAFPARYFAHLHATQNPEKSTEFALPESITFPRAGRYRLQIMANLLNPQTPMWEDPSQLTRNREVELVQIGPGGEIWGRMESGAGTMLGDGVEVVVLGTNGEENGKENGAKGDQMDVKVVVKGEGEEHSWVDFEKSLVETNGSTSYSASASWVDRTPTDLNAIADRCQVLLVTFTEQNNGKKKAVMDFVATSRLPHIDAVSPFHITVISQDSISHSHAALGLQGAAQLGDGGMPDFCNRHVFQKAAEFYQTSSATFTDGTDSPFDRIDPTNPSDIDPALVRFGPSFILPLSFPRDGDYRVVVQGTRESGEKLVAGFAVTIGSSTQVLEQLSPTAIVSTTSALSSLPFSILIGSIGGLLSGIAVFAGWLLHNRRQSGSKEANNSTFAYAHMPIHEEWSLPVGINGGLVIKEGEMEVVARQQAVEDEEEDEMLLAVPPGTPETQV